MNPAPSSTPDSEQMARVFRKNEVLSTRKIGDEVILVPIRGKLAQLQQVFSLNPVGAFIWDRLDGVLNLKGLKSRVTETFDVQEATAEADLLSHIRELEEADLIVEVQRADD